MKNNLFSLLAIPLFIALLIPPKTQAEFSRSWQTFYNPYAYKMFDVNFNAQNTLFAEQTISQNSSLIIEPGEGVTCNNEIRTSETKFYRYFNLPGNHSINNGFDVTSVQFGIEGFTEIAATGYPITINIYSASVGAYPSVTTTLAGSAVYTANGSEVLQLIDLDLSASIPAGQAMVMEMVFPEDGVTLAWPGFNLAGDTAPSYIASAPCGIANPVTTASIGFGAVVFTVTGDALPDDGGDPCDAVDVPYYQDFESASVPNMPDCTSVQNAGSGNNWTTSNIADGEFTGTFLSYQYGANAANSWFYTQGINLNAGSTYKISYEYGSKSAAAFPENLRVAYGSDNTDTAMTNVLAEHEGILSGATKLTNTVEFNPTSSGVYYFGFNAYSTADQWFLYADNIAIELVDDDGGSDEGCAQDFFVSGASISDASIYTNGASVYGPSEYVTANDILVPAHSSFKPETISFGVVALGGNPTNFTLQVYSDNGAGGVGAPFGSAFTVTPAQYSATASGNWNGAFPTYLISIDASVANIVLENDSDTDTFFWLGIQGDPTTTDSNIFWLAYDYTIGSATNPTMFSGDNGASWAAFGEEDGEAYDGAFKVEGICEDLDDGGTSGNECSQGVPSFATVPNAYNITIGNAFYTADDFTVDSNFSMNKIAIDTNQVNAPETSIITIYEDNGGQPGNIKYTVNVAPTTSTVVGSAFGDPIYHSEYELDTPLEFTPGTYWLASKMSNSSGETIWLAVTDEASWGAAPQRSTDDGSNWAEDTSGMNVVMMVYGICSDQETCTGTPDAGTITVTPEQGFPGSTYVVSASGYSITSGLSFQWQSNTNGAGWVNEGAASETYSNYEAIAPDGAGTVVDWRLEVTCTHSGESAVSDEKPFTVLDPGNGCNWTVTVFDDTWFGDEVSWTLKDASGTTLLSGGPYDDLGYFDEQSVFAEGPLEFFITADGFFGDNTPSYSVANDNGIVVSGSLSGNSVTHSDLNCDSTPPPPPAFTCEDNHVDSNNLENGGFFGGDSNQRLAIDVIAGEGGFTAYGVNLNVFVESGDTDLFFDFTFYEDQGGLPGNTIGGQGGTIISTDIVGSAFGYDVYNFVVKFDEPVNFEANTTTWMEVFSTGVAWESRASGIFGSPGAFWNDNTSDWTLGNSEYVYALECEELGLSNFNNYEFAYYPNPVSSVLNIQSQKNIQSVSAFNLTGQKVLSDAKVTNGQIDISALATGTYVFRVVLEGNKVETFKIIKK